MKEQIPANVMNDTNIYTLEASNTGVDWLNNFSTPHFELVERTTEVNRLTFRLGMLAVALGAIPVGQYALHDINNERYEIRRSVDNMDLQLPTEYIVHTESQIDEAQEWVTDEKERKIQ